MKKLLLATLITLISTAPAFAHCGGCGVGGAKGSASHEMDQKMMIEKKVEMMQEKLGLSNKQASQLKAAMQEKKAQKKAAKETYQAKLKKILTPEQHKQYKKMKEQMHGSHSHKGSGSHKGSQSH